MRSTRGIKKKLLFSLLGAGAALAIAAPAANAALSWSQPSHDFGSQNVGSPAPAKTLVLTATCDTFLGLSPFTCVVPAGGVNAFGLPAVTGEGFSIDNTANSCVAAVLVTPTGTSGPAACVTTVNFTPTSAGAKTGSLNLPTGPDVALSGTGVALPTVTKKCKKGKKLKNGKCVKKKKKGKRK